MSQSGVSDIRTGAAEEECPEGRRHARRDVARDPEPTLVGSLRGYRVVAMFTNLAKRIDYSWWECARVGATVDGVYCRALTCAT